MNRRQLGLIKDLLWEGHQPLRKSGVLTQYIIDLYVVWKTSWNWRNFGPVRGILKLHVVTHWLTGSPTVSRSGSIWFKCVAYLILLLTLTLPHVTIVLFAFFLVCGHWFWSYFSTCACFFLGHRNCWQAPSLHHIVVHMTSIDLPPGENRTKTKPGNMKNVFGPSLWNFRSLYTFCGTIYGAVEVQTCCRNALLLFSLRKANGKSFSKGVPQGNLVAVLTASSHIESDRSRSVRTALFYY